MVKIRKQKSKIRIGIIFGGKSTEHEVSLQSAKNVIAALDKNKYEPILIGIDKSGKWHVSKNSANFLLNAENPSLIKLNKAFTNEVMLAAGEQGGTIVPLSRQQQTKIVDVVFPVLHGPLGEDGTVQGLLKLMDVPFVGAGVLGSAIGMDKDVQKRLLRAANIPVAEFIVVRRSELKNLNYAKIKKFLGLPLFVKPANAGSSVGVSKVKNEKEFVAAVRHAFLYDEKILVEKAIVGREIEVSVLGNENPKASVPGEVLPQHEFYSYEAKYIDENGAAIQIPAKLLKGVANQIQKLAVETFKVLCCEGMARVDCFLTSKNKIYINEINTIPGFTKISMYPKLWQATGLSYGKLIDELVSLAIERYEKEKNTRTSY